MKSSFTLGASRLFVRAGIILAIASSLSVALVGMRGNITGSTVGKVFNLLSLTSSEEASASLVPELIQTSASPSAMSMMMNCAISPCLAAHTTLIEIDDLPICGIGSTGFEGDVQSTQPDCISGGLNCHVFKVFRDMNSISQSFMLEVGQGNGCNGELDLTLSQIGGICDTLSNGGSNTSIMFTFPNNVDTIFLFFCINSGAFTTICDMCRVGVADLSLMKTVSYNPMTNEATFSVMISNDGTDGGTGIFVTDSLPDGYSYVSHVATQGTYNPVNGLWNVGSIPNPGSATLTIVTTVNPNGNLINIAEITGSNEEDEDSDPNANEGEDDLGDGLPDDDEDRAELNFACPMCSVIGPVDVQCVSIDTFEVDLMDLLGTCPNPIYDWSVMGDYDSFTVDSNLIYVTSSGVCSGNYMIEVSITCDDCAEPIICGTSVNVTDDVDPVCPEPPGDEMYTCVTLVPSAGDLTATDECQGDIIATGSDTDNAGAGCIGDTLIIIRTWTFDDGCGNSCSVSQEIRVVDNVLPTFDQSCPSDTTVNCNTIPSAPILTASDNCGTADVVPSEDSTLDTDGPCEYTITRTWTATDECGNTDECVQVITVVDTVSPICPVPPTDEFYTCVTLVPPAGDLTATDECQEDITVTGSDTDNAGAGCSANPLIITRTWTFDDGCGNTCSVSQTITVADTIPPSISCPADFTLSTSDSSTDTMFTGVPTINDNCGDYVLEVSDAARLVNCPAALDLIVRTFRAEDECGNVSSCTQLIYIPCPEDLDVPCGPCMIAGPASVCPSSVDTFTVSVDACLNPVYTWSVTNGAVIASGQGNDTITVTAPATCNVQYVVMISITCDSCVAGTSPILCSDTVTVEDLIPPSLSCPDNVILPCGSATDPGSTGMPTLINDNCSSVLGATFSDVGEGDACDSTILRTWSVMDDCGNVTTCLQRISLIDTLDPVCPTPPDDILYTCVTLVPPPGDLTAVDACQGDIIATGSDSDNAGAGCSANPLIITRTWTFDDGCGNTCSVSQTITVADIIPPTITTPEDQVVECGDVVAFGDPIVADNCQLLDVTFADMTGSSIFETLSGSEEVPPNVSTATGTLTGGYDDATNMLFFCVEFSGLSAPATAAHVHIAAMGVNGPVIIPLPIPAAISGNFCYSGVISPAHEAALLAGGLYINIHTSIFPGGEIRSQLAVDCGQTVKRTWTATDACGNASTASAFIQVVDTTPPAPLTCPSAVDLGCNPQGIPEPELLTTIDDCDGVITATLLPSDIIAVGCERFLTRTYIATDACGNSATCTQYFTWIVDTTPPSLTCNVDPITVENCTPGELPPPPNISGSDNCSGPLTYEFDGKYYSLTSEGSWLDVRNEALSLGGDLVAINSAAENAFLGATFSQSESRWIGYTDETSEGSFVWINGDPNGYENWNIGEPNNVGDEDHVEISQSGGFWNDAAGSLLRRGIVESLIPSETQVTIDTLAVDTLGCQGRVTYLYTASDACGNEAQCTQVVFYPADSTPPEITGCDDITINGCFTDIEALLEDLEDDAEDGDFAEPIDNCEIDFFDADASFFSDVQGQCGVIIRMQYFAADACGNSTSCTQFITVVDNEPPVIGSGGSPGVPCQGGSGCTGSAPPYCDQEQGGPGFPSNPACQATVCAVDPFCCETQWDAICAGEAADLCCGCLTPSFTPPPAGTSCDEAWGGQGYSTDCDCQTAVCAIDPFCCNTAWDGICAGQAATAPECCGCLTVPTCGEAPCQPLTVQCGDPIPFTPITASDNCDQSVEITYVDRFVAGDCPEIIFRTWYAADDCGNRSSCTQQITIVDTTPPAPLVCPASVDLGCNPDELPAPEVLTTVDDCGGIITAVVIPTIVTIDGCRATLIRIYRATDDCGNSVSCTQVITWTVDTTPPAALTCPADVDLGCNPPAIPLPVDLTTSDNCSGTITATLLPSDIVAVGCQRFLQRTYRAIDACGNSVSCTQNFTWTVDTTPPSLTCLDSGNVICGFEVEEGEPGMPLVGDNCDTDVSLTYVQVTTAGDCPQEYSILTTWYAEDDCGNRSSCTQRINVVDPVAPSIFCPSAGLFALNPWTSSVPDIALYDVDLVDCTVSIDGSYSGPDFNTQSLLSRFGFDVNPITGEVYLLASTQGQFNNTDRRLYRLDIVSGATVEIGQLISSSGSVLPADITFDGAGTLYAVFQNGELHTVDPVTLVTTLVASVNSTFGAGITYDFDANRILYANGAFGSVDIYEITLPGFSVNFLFNTNATTTHQALEYIGDNKLISSGTGASNTILTIDLLTTISTVISSPTGSFDNIKDLMWIGGTQGYVECAEMIEFPDPSETGIPLVFDLCGGAVTVDYTDVLGPTDDPCITQYIIRTWSAVDECGNVSTCNQLIDVLDTTPPTISCPADISAECGLLPAPDPQSVFASDDCDDDVFVTWVSDEAVQGQQCAFDVIRTYRAEDDCGNSVSCTQRIIGGDSTPPEFVIGGGGNGPFCDQGGSAGFPSDPGCENAICSFDPFCCDVAWDFICAGAALVNPACCACLTVPTCPTGGGSPCEPLTVQCGDPIPVAQVSATDNCDEEPFVTFSDSENRGQCPVVSVITRTWYAIDDCGNTTSCTQTITIIDNIAPEITCPANVTIGCGETGGLLTLYSVAGGSTPDDLIRTINPNTAQTIGSVSMTLPGFIVTGGLGLAKHPGTQELYAVVRVAASAIRRLVTVDPSTGMCTDIGAMGTNFAGLAFNGDGSILWAVTGEGGGSPESLFEVDQTDGSTTFLCVLGNGSDGETIAFNPSDGALYHASGHFGDSEVIFELITDAAVDPCDVTDIDITGTALVDEETQALTWWSGADVFLWKQNHGPSGPLFSVTTSGVPTLIGDMDHQSKGLAFVGTDVSVPIVTDNCDESPLLTYVDVVVEGVCGTEITRTWIAEDACGNSSSCVQTIVQLNGEELVMTCTKPAPFFCPEELPTPEFLAEWLITEGYASASSECPGTQVIFTEFYPLDNNCALAWTFGFTAEDACGNRADTCYIIVQLYHDDSAPQITCSSPPHLGCNPQSIPTAQQLITTGFVSASDSCGPVSLGFIPPFIQTNVGCEYSRQYRYRATDGCGNQSEICIVTVNWTVDITPPSLTCPADLVLECTDVIPTPEVATATDDCELVIVTYVGEVGSGDSCDSLIVRTYYALDACGNESFCTQQIRILDTTPPAIVCPGLIVLECGVDTVPVTNAIVTDNCHDFEVTYSDEEFPQICDGGVLVDGQFKVVTLIVRTFYAVDECDNASSCTQHIIIRDDTPPTLTCPEDITIQCDQDPNDLMVTGEATAVDLCDPDAYATILIQFPEFASACSTVLIRIWEATDHCGNGGSSELCVQRITIVDTEGPTIVCPADVTIECGTPLPMACPIVSDNCTEVEFLTPVSGALAAGDPLTRMRFTDAGVCTATACTAPGRWHDAATITVTQAGLYTFSGNFSGDGMGGIYSGTFDPLNPCVNFLDGDDDSNGNLDPLIFACILVPGQYVLVSTSFSCVNTAMTYAWTIQHSEVTISSVDSDPIGTCPMVIIRTHYATDDCGNVSSCTQRFTIRDTTPPAIVCPIDVTIECGDPLPTTLPSATDICGDVTFGHTDMDIEVLPITLTFNGSALSTAGTATIPSAGSGGCAAAPQTTGGTMFNNTVSGLSASGDPVQVTLTLTHSFDGDLDMYLIAPNSQILELSTDNGGSGDNFTNTRFRGDGLTNITAGVAPYNGIFRPEGTLTASACGTTITPTVTTLAGFTDGQNGTWQLRIKDDATGDVGAMVSWSITFNDVEMISCGSLVKRTHVVTDECGNTSSCMQFIRIIDTTPPSITCPDNVTIECGDPLPASAATATDICDIDPFVTMISEVSTVRQDGSCLYYVIRTFTAEDECGNSSICTQVITVEDTTAPELTCPEDYTIDCQELTCLTFDDVVVNPFGAPVDVSVINEGGITINVLAYSKFGVPRTPVLFDTENPHPSEDDLGTPNILYGGPGVSGDDVNGFEASNNQPRGKAIIVQQNGSLYPDDHIISDSLVFEFSEPVYLISLVAVDFESAQAANGAGLTMFDEDGAILSFVPFAGGPDNNVDDMNLQQQGVSRLLVYYGNTVPSSGGIANMCFVYVPKNIEEAIVSDNCNEIEVNCNEAVTIVDECITEIVRTFSAIDECGNASASCTQTITIETDTEKPTIQCPDEVVFECSSQEILIPAPDPGSVVASDNCTATGDLIITWVRDIVDEDECESVVRRVYSAEDECGNVALCVQYFRVVDTTPPSITCPVDATIECGDDLPTTLATASDLCNEYTLTYTDSEAVGSCPMVVTRTHYATDVCGNRSSCTQYIFIEDTTAPEIDCPNNVTIECGDPLPTTQASATDICSSGVIGEGPFCNVPSFFPGFPSNPACEAAICAADPFCCEVAWDGLCAGAAAQLTVCASCLSGSSEGITLSYEDSAPEGECPMVVTRTHFAEDECGNVASCTQYIYIRDTTPPSITCPEDLTLECGVDPIPTTLATATDICDVEVDLTYVDVEYPQVCDNDVIVGGVDQVLVLIVRTHYATDNCGNIATCTQHILIRDDTPPSVTCVDDVTIECDQDPNDYELTGIPTLVDLCDPDAFATILQEFTSFTSPCSTVITRIWIATDHCGNGGSGGLCPQLITIVDTTPPSITCPADATIECGDDLPTTLATGTDNCNDVSFTYSDGEASGECPVVIVRTHYASDECGNVSSCTQRIYIEDTTAPEITCPAPVTLECGDALPTTLATAIDVCTTDIDYTYSDSDVLDGSTGCTWTIARTHYATDNCGNVASCVQIILIVDTTPPSITCPVDVTIECTEMAALESATATDLCSDDVFVTIVNEQVNGGSCIYTIVRTYRAVDGCGNASTCTQVITVEDTTAPEVSCPANIELGCPAATCLTFDDIFVGMDSVLLPTVVQGGITINITAWSKGGVQRSPGLFNTSTPHPDDLDLGTPNIVYGGPGESNDHPDGYEFSNNRPLGNILIVQQHNASYPNDHFLSDSIVFNFSEPVFMENVVVMDFETPSIATGAGIFLYDADGALISFTAFTGDGLDNSQEEVVLKEAGVKKMKLYYGTAIPSSGGIGSLCYVYVPCSADEANASDACSEISISCTDTTQIVDDCITQIIRTYSAEDECGNVNESACTQVLTLETDGLQPEVMCPADLILACGDPLPAPDPSLVSATDNCSAPEDIDIIWVEDIVMGFGCDEEVRRIYQATDECGNVALCVQFITRQGPPVQLSARVLLGGSMEAGAFDMYTLINNLLPEDQPYFMPPSEYPGPEQVAPFPANIVDWVLVELRDVVTMEPIGKRSALVTSTGDIVDLDGVSPLMFTATPDQYYVVICHRNHLDILSDGPVDMTGLVGTLDFTLGNNGMIQLSNGTWAMIKGDVNSDGLVNNTDLVLLAPKAAIGYSGEYLEFDVNMDGLVNNTDLVVLAPFAAVGYAQGF